VIKLSTRALSESLGIDASAIALVSMTRQEFADAALECRQAGEAVATVVTPGYQVILSANGQEYELHTTLDGAIVRCLPTETPQLTPSEPAPGLPTPVPDETLQAIASALKTKDYEQLAAHTQTDFWLGFYASEAGKMPREEAIEKLQTFYLGPGLVRVHWDVSVTELLPDWTNAAPYARFVYSTGWGEGQRDDAILLFEEQGEKLYWAGIFYIFDDLKKSAYGAKLTQLPLPPIDNLGAIAQAIENKQYEAIESLLSDPVFLGLYASEASELSPDAFVEALQRNYLEPGAVQVRFDVDVRRLLPEWSADVSCDELLYSTGWGEEQVDDGILCLKNEAGIVRWSGMLYVFDSVAQEAYAIEIPSLEEKEATSVEGMVFIPAGPFIMGSSADEMGTAQAACLQGGANCNVAQFQDEIPARTVTLDAYYIDRTQVTVAQFKTFVEATGYQTTSEAKGDPVQYTWRAFDTPERQNHPVRWMSWHDASAYCQWAGKRLPTEAEWEKAARGTLGLIYPWGQAWDDSRVPQGDTAPVDAFAAGASPYGVLGMAGGVWEWVNDWYDLTYYQYGPTVNPTGPAETRDKVLRGGAFGNASWKHRSAYRHYGGAVGYAHDHGFRCARDE